MRVDSVHHEASFLLFLVILAHQKICCIPTARPNIIFILADDLGWNDVGFHGSNQIPTPNLDALAYSGIILNNYYVSPICTPSRSALMTGKHPIHTGMQHGVLYGAEARGLSLREKLLSQYLKQLGYSNHIVGKWHLGFYKQEYTPIWRGFDSHLGFWSGHQDYNDHTAVEAPGWGLDMRRNMQVAYDLHGQYSTDIFGKEAERIILNHNQSNPLFLYLAHAAVHSGNPYNPQPVPDEEAQKFTQIHNYTRQRFAGMLKKMDDSVGRVISALGRKNMLENSIIVFSTDNGGPAAGFNANAASNWPLRGVKNTLWEGGVRAAGLLWSPLIETSQRVASQMMHITDWLPTLYSAIGENVVDLGNIDGFNLWNSLSKDEPSPREEILHNIDDIFGNSALTKNDWKIVKGSTYSGAWDHWYGPSGRDNEYDIQKVLNSPAALELKKIGKLVDAHYSTIIRNNALVRCLNNVAVSCEPLRAPCLFNVKDDPCEQENLAQKYPDILDQLESRLNVWNKTAVPPTNLPLDPKGDPRRWNYVWTNFGDF